MHLDIIGLSELRVTNHNFPKNQRFTTNSDYQFFWATDENKEDSVAGCMLAVKKDISKHVQKFHIFKGHLIALDLFFLRDLIVQLYVPNRLLHEARSKQFKIIVMGDFNENMDDCLQLCLKGNTPNNYRVQFLNLMSSHKLYNTMEHFTSYPYEKRGTKRLE